LHVIYWDQQFSDVERLDSKMWRLRLLLLHMRQTGPQKVIDLLLERVMKPLSTELDCRSDIVFERQGCTHASKHNVFDVMMHSIAQEPE
jgi:hypothetical protein